MTRLHLTRHGETIWHSENRYAGSSDVALTERGHEQADQLARWAGSRPLQAIYSSDLRRAIQTAAPAAKASGLEPVVDARLREVHFGAAEGMTAAELRAQLPSERLAFEQRPARSPFPGGEAGTDAIERVWPAIEQIAERHDGEVLVVMHSTLLRLVICHALGIDPDRYRSAFPSVLNVGITTFDIQGKTIGLLGFNVSSE